jgi:hypothetical protein
MVSLYEKRLKKYRVKIRKMMKMEEVEGDGGEDTTSPEELEPEPEPEPAEHEEENKNKETNLSPNFESKMIHTPLDPPTTWVHILLNAKEQLKNFRRMY